MTKTCSGCHAEKPLTEFHKHVQAGDGLKSWCKVCCLADLKRWRSAHPKQYKALSTKSRTDSRVAVLRAKYGMTLEDFAAMVAAQGSRCAICASDDPGGRWGTWCIDHDHQSGRVRALLCVACNSGIGHLRDDPVRCDAAAAYLRKHASASHVASHR